MDRTQLLLALSIALFALGLLGLSYEAPFFGQDVLHTPSSARIALFSHDHEVISYRLSTTRRPILAQAQDASVAPAESATACRRRARRISAGTVNRSATMRLPSVTVIGRPSRSRSSYACPVFRTRKIRLTRRVATAHRACLWW